MSKRPVREILVVLSLLAVVVPKNSFGINSQPSPTAEDGGGVSVAVCPFYTVSKGGLESAAHLFPAVVATNCNPNSQSQEPQQPALGIAFFESTLAAIEREMPDKKPLYVGVNSDPIPKPVLVPQDQTGPGLATIPGDDFGGIGIAIITTGDSVTSSSATYDTAGYITSDQATTSELEMLDDGGSSSPSQSATASAEKSLVSNQALVAYSE